MKKLIVFIFLAASTLLNAQNEAAIWYFGKNAGLDFTSGTPVALTDGALSTLEGCSSIADVNGNILLYTDGKTVWNRNHLSMPNGTGLLGHASSTQSGIIVPSPGNPDIYYVFTVDDFGNPNGFRYTIVDMTLDGGLGDITTKNVLLQTPVLEKLTAVTHANGTDIWVMVHGYQNNEYAAYLVTAAGVSTTPVVTAIGPTATIIPHVGGYLKFSPDGSLLASASAQDNFLHLFHFDTATGVVSDFIDISPFYQTFQNNRFNYGLEFSSDSSKLYVQSADLFNFSKVEYKLYQFDLSTYSYAAIAAAPTLLRRQFEEIAALQLAIDGKIYVAEFDQTYLSAINNPNVLGLGAGFVKNAVSLNGKKCQLGLPPFIQTYFIVGLKANKFCLGDATEFSVTTSGTVTSIIWDFGDGGTSTLETPTHVYAAPGTYTVSVTASTASETKTETKEITIYETPIANTAATIEVCNATATSTFDLTTKNAEILGAQSAANTIIRYFPTLADAQNNTNVLPNTYTNTQALVTIYARIANSSNPSCYATTSFDIIVKQAPVLNTTITNWIVCDDNSDGFSDFDFTTKDAEVLDGQNTNIFSVSFFENATDALNYTNPISGVYTNVSTPQEIHFRISNTNHTECFETGSFEIEVINGVTVNSPTAFEICDTDTDGYADFDLSTKDIEILGSQNPANHTVAYYLTQQDADANAKALNKTNYTNTSAYTQTVYVRVSNVNNSLCYETTTLELKLYDVPVLTKVADWQVCDTDNDGIFSFDLTEKDTELLGSQSVAEFRLSYYETAADANVGANAIVGLWNNTTRQQQLFYRIENRLNSSCYLTDSFSVIVSDMPLVNSVTPLVACDENETGTHTFDLSLKDHEILGSQSPLQYSLSYFSNEADAIANQNTLNKNTYTNQQPAETIYARITNIGFASCYALTSFELLLNPLPEMTIAATYVICPDSPNLFIDGGNFESWEWRDDEHTVIAITQEIAITELGEYTLRVTQTSNGVICENTAHFEVVSSGAPESFSIDTSGFSDQVRLLVTAEGMGDFEYSIDGVNFQSSNEFEVFPGLYSVYVRDPFLCRTLTEEIMVLGYQKFFTPNGDGTNEYWNIIGRETYPNALLFIYDRYGKLVKQISPSALGWDGTYLGNPLPAADYWFRFEYDQGKVVNGHFSLKR